MSEFYLVDFIRWVFARKKKIKEIRLLSEMRKQCRNACFLVCSLSGNIADLST